MARCGSVCELRVSRGATLRTSASMCYGPRPPPPDRITRFATGRSRFTGLETPVSVLDGRRRSCSVGHAAAAAARAGSHSQAATPVARLTLPCSPSADAVVSASGAETARTVLLERVALTAATADHKKLLKPVRPSCLAGSLASPATTSALVDVTPMQTCTNSVIHSGPLQVFMFKQTNVRVLTRPPTQKNHNAEATAASSRNQNGSAEQQQRPAQSVRKADPGGLSAMVHNLLRRISPACGPRKSQRPRSKTAASTSPSASVTPTPTASRPTSLQREKAGTARKWTKSQLVRGASWHEPDDCAMRNVRVMSCTSSGTRSIMQRLCRSRTLTPYNAHADCACQLNGPRESASATWTPVMHDLSASESSNSGFVQTGNSGKTDKRTLSSPGERQAINDKTNEERNIAAEDRSVDRNSPSARSKSNQSRSQLTPEPEPETPDAGMLTARRHKAIKLSLTAFGYGAQPYSASRALKSLNDLRSPTLSPLQSPSVAKATLNATRVSLAAMFTCKHDSLKRFSSQMSKLSCKVKIRRTSSF